MTIINGADEDVQRQQEAMEERRLQAKQAKLAKVSTKGCVRYIIVLIDVRMCIYTHVNVEVANVKFTTMNN